MASSAAMRLEDLCPDSPVLYHQYALSQVLQRRNSQARRQPTQLVYPDGCIAIGFPPKPLEAASFPLPSSGAANVSENDLESTATNAADPQSGVSGGEDSSNGQSQAVVYVSETPVFQIGTKFRMARGLLVLTVVLQSFQILSLFFGGPLVSLVDLSFSPPPTGAAVQRVYYFGCLASHLLVALGLSLRSPMLLTIYGALQVAATTAGAASWLTIDIDVVVVALSLANRFASSKVSVLLMPHAFVAAQSP